ncbi:MAG: Ig-like domain-containing protein [Candidatus Sulfotelmatobacter sp.]
MRWLLLVPVLAALLLLASCGGSSDSSTTSPAPPSGSTTLQSITITPSVATIAQGTTQAFTATGNYSDGSTKDLTATAQWSCLLPNTATVSSSSPTQGLAMGISPGSVVISASSGSLSNSAQLNITGATLSSLAVSPAMVTIGFVNQQQYKAKATFSDTSQQDVTDLASWSFSPSGPFITSLSGLAIGNSIGTYQVEAEFGGQSTLSSPTPPTLTVDLSNLVSVAIQPANPTIANNTGVTFSAIGTFNDGSTRDVTSLVTEWSSSNSAVAANNVAPNAFAAAATGVPLPTAVTITATIGTFSPIAPATLTVSDATLQSVAVSPASATIAPTTQIDYTATGMFSDGSTQDLTSLVKWSTTNPPAKFSKSTLAGESAGTTTVNATAPKNLASVEGSGTITVTSATPQTIAVTPATAFLPPGGTLTYSAMATFSDGSTQDVSSLAIWTTGSANVASIASNKLPVLTGQGVGQSTITAKWSAMSGTASLLVASPKQISIAVAPATASVGVGASTQLKATGTFVDGTTQDFTALVNWSSSNATAATVGYQTGLVSGLTSGASTITATLGSSTSTAQVTVQ